MSKERGASLLAPVFLLMAARQRTNVSRKGGLFSYIPKAYMVDKLERFCHRVAS